MGTVRRMTARAPKLAPTAGAMALATLDTKLDDDRWRVRVGAQTLMAQRDPAVDPALLDAAHREGARVVLDLAGDAVIAGTLTTARPVTVARDGSVQLDVTRFVVTAAEEAMLRTRAAFVQVKGADVETFGERVVSRARELLKVLGRNVRIN